MMRDRLDLSSTPEQLHALLEAVEHTRQSSKAVRCDRAALQALLIDHSRLCKRLEELGVTTWNDA